MGVLIFAFIFTFGIISFVFSLIMLLIKKLKNKTPCILKEIETFTMKICNNLDSVYKTIILLIILLQFLLFWGYNILGYIPVNVNIVFGVLMAFIHFLFFHNKNIYTYK